MFCKCAGTICHDNSLQAKSCSMQVSVTIRAARIVMDMFSPTRTAHVESCAGQARGDSPPVALAARTSAMPPQRSGERKHAGAGNLLGQRSPPGVKPMLCVS